MKRNFTQSFKIQAVEKALNRDSNTNLKQVATSLGIGFSTLNRWIVKARKQEFKTDCIYYYKEFIGLSITEGF